MLLDKGNGAMSNQEPLVKDLAKSSLPYYKDGFTMEDITAVSKDGQYGEYVWGRAVVLVSTTTQKRYILQLKESDPLLGGLLYMLDGENRTVKFVRGQKDGEILVSGVPTKSKA